MDAVQLNSNSKNCHKKTSRLHSIVGFHYSIPKDFILKIIPKDSNPTYNLHPFQLISYIRGSMSNSFTELPPTTVNSGLSLVTTDAVKTTAPRSTVTSE